MFTRRDRDGELLADPNQILFFRRGDPYRFAHPLPGGDDCTILELEPTCARIAVEEFAVRDAENSRAPFRLGHALSTFRVTWLHHALLSATRGSGPAAPLVREELVAELIDESLRAVSAQGSVRRDLDRSRASTHRRRELVEGAKLALNEQFESPPRLADLAAALGCSPFHLSRVFRIVTGVGLRHYLRALRVRLAADSLARGARNLTELALELGYFDHSHFTNDFRKALGVPPSRLARASAPARAT